MIRLLREPTHPVLPLLLSALAAVAAGCGGEAANGAPPAEEAAAPEERHRLVDVSDLGFDEGDADRAVVQVIEFSDFGCGYCRLFHDETYPALYEEFVVTGQVAWKYIPFVMGTFPNGEEVTLAAECAGEQDRFPQMRDILFRQQGEWTRSTDPESLREGYAREAGVDMDRFASCLAEGRRVERLDMANQAAARLGVRGTPTFFVSGQPVQGAIPLDLFQEVLREQVALRTPPGPRPTGAQPPPSPPATGSSANPSTSPAPPGG